MPSRCFAWGQRSILVATDEQPTGMAEKASTEALSAAGITASDIDLVIYTGVMRDRPAPWVAAHKVAASLGIEAVAFDLSTRCTGIHRRVVDGVVLDRVWPSNNSACLCR